MNKATQLWDIDRKRAFFRAYIQRETSLDAASADKLAEALTKAVNMMRVWDVPPIAEAPPPAPASDTPTETPTGKRTPKSPPTETAPPFNPYAFSAIVVLSKAGKDGLIKRLNDIKSVENLKAFADAQHLAVSPTIKKADELRRAIVAATEQRLADRKAAAS